MKEKIKSTEGWFNEPGNKNWYEYCQIGDIVSEDVPDYFLNVAPPAAVSNDYVQMGEPYKHGYNPLSGCYEPSFLTFAKNEKGDWVYCGNCFYKSYRDMDQISGYTSICHYLKRTGFETDTKIQMRIFCRDGFSIHLCAGEEFYCVPREYRKDGKYTHIEAGYPNKKEELLMPYAEDPEYPTETVYGKVPTDLIDKVIQKHGGFAG